MNPLSAMFDALTFRTEGLMNLKKSPLVFWHGALVLAIIALVVGFFSEGVNELSRVGRPLPTANEITRDIETRLAQLPLEPRTREMIILTARESVAMRLDLDALTPRGGTGVKALDAALSFLGRWFSTPFHAGWLPFLFFGGIFTHLAARLLGGRGTIAEFLGLTALAYSPAILNVLTILLGVVDQSTRLLGVSGLIGIVSLLVTVWQVAIYTKAIAVAHQMSVGRSLAVILVTLAFFVALLLLLLLSLILLIGILIVSAR